MRDLPDSVKIAIADLLLERSEARAEVERLKMEAEAIAQSIHEAMNEFDNLDDLKTCLDAVLQEIREKMLGGAI